ncbi:unnamed protein product, partial [Sphacelaria rigidula]
GGRRGKGGRGSGGRGYSAPVADSWPALGEAPGGDAGTGREKTAFPAAGSGSRSASPRAEISEGWGDEAKKLGGGGDVARSRNDGSTWEQTPDGGGGGGAGWDETPQASIGGRDATPVQKLTWPPVQGKNVAGGADGRGRSSGRGRERRSSQGDGTSGGRGLGAAERGVQTSGTKSSGGSSSVYSSNAYNRGSGVSSWPNQQSQTGEGDGGGGWPQAGTTATISNAKSRSPESNGWAGAAARGGRGGRGIAGGRGRQNASPNAGRGRSGQ